MPAKMQHANFLVEIHTEELPPKALLSLAQHFLSEIKIRLQQAELTFTDAVYFASPRRLAVLVKNLSAKQPAREIERKGPALVAAFNANAQPTPACIGFARSLNVTPAQLIILKNPQGEWVGLRQTIAGKTVFDLLPTLVADALQALPIPKRMRWNSGKSEFVRPVHSVLMLYGNKKIPGTLFDLKLSNETRGHRFHSKGRIKLRNTDEYESVLEKHFVIADFEKRKQLIREQSQSALHKHFPLAKVFFKESLLNEVTGLVEWPEALIGNFDEDFLKVPEEALISAMQAHQRYFPVLDANGKLLPHFVIISNIKSRSPDAVIAGNERVLRARLSDAAFFFATDKKQTALERLEILKTVVFQDKLGTLFDKAERLAALTSHIAIRLNMDPKKAALAGRLAKTDLCTQLVGEFPELQGTAGRYYALHEGQPEEVATALYEQYLPRFSGDQLPETALGQALSLADRLDTLVGTFGTNNQPTGDKDPFALRRSALGLLRILIEQKLNLQLPELLKWAHDAYQEKLPNPNTQTQLIHFMLDRLKAWYLEKGISADVFASVAALKLNAPYDFHLRILAVNAFKKMPEAEALSIANKRVSHILEKYAETIQLQKVDEHLFEFDAEKKLAQELIAQQEKIQQDVDYSDSLSRLAGLRGTVDVFFDKVLVMTEDKSRRENRLLLLKQLRELFLHVADIALLQ